MMKLLPFMLFIIYAGCSHVDPQHDIGYGYGWTYKRTSAMSGGISMEEANYAARLVNAQIPGSTEPWRLTGNSMLPALSRNCYIVSKRLPYDELRVGMVVRYYSNKGKRIVHRLIYRYKDGSYSVRGDNNYRMDKEVVTKHNYYDTVIGVFYFRDE
jgi:hypothetical protein